MATNRTTIHASRSAVWATLSDGWTYSNWVVGTSHMRAVQAGWPAAGTKLFHASGAWPAVTRDETEVEQSVTDERLVLTARGRPFGEARIEISLADTPDGCEVTIAEQPVSGPGKWMHNPVSEAVLARRNTETLARLSAMCERRTEPIDRQTR